MSNVLDTKLSSIINYQYVLIKRRVLGEIPDCSSLRLESRLMAHPVYNSSREVLSELPGDVVRTDLCTASTTGKRARLSIYEAYR